MKYFRIRNEFEPKVTGIRSGTSPSRVTASVFQGKEWLNEFLYKGDAGMRRGNFPIWDFKLELPLDKPVKLTDFISVGALRCGFIVNEKVIKILETCKLPPHKYYEITFNKDGTTIEGYFWFYYNLFDGSKYINYEKTIFDIEEEEKELGQKIQIKNYEDYIRLTDKIGKAPHVPKIVFDKTFDKEIDLFGMRFFGSFNYASETLKKKFEENKIVGYRLRYPLTDPEVEWE